MTNWFSGFHWPADAIVFMLVVVVFLWAIDKKLSRLADEQRQINQKIQYLADAEYRRQRGG